MNNTCIFVMDSICYVQIPSEFSRCGALGPGRVGSLLISQINVYACLAYIDTNRLNHYLLCVINMPQYII